jgi:hypothetical protein
LFIVPQPAPTPEPAPGAAAASPAGAEAAAGPNAVGKYRDWILDLHLHVVNPTKLKLKPGSLLQEYETADVGFAATEILVATVFKGGGPFRGMQEPKKKAAARETMLEHLKADGAADQLPLPRQVVISAEDVGQLKVVQPASPLEESIFADVPVFGAGRIVIRLPGAPVAGERLYLSFSLSEFREFARLLAQSFGLENLGQELGIPLVDEISELKCHYSDTVLQSLGNLEFYRADPKFKIVLIGRKCQGCGLIVSEDSRKKEKIGGPSGSGIAKAICPKCKKKFGEISLFGLGAAPKPAMESAPAK